MARGGARNRSGPSVDPLSARSDARGVKLSALPAGGYSGEVPDFPLPTVTRYMDEYEDKRRIRVADEAATEVFRERELAVWAEAWRTPQAAAWAAESWRWPILAEYCRLKTVVELEPDANASLVAQLHRFRDQLGLTPAGMKENGWTVAVGEVTEERRTTVERVAPVRRLRAVTDGE